MHDKNAASWYANIGGRKEGPATEEGMRQWIAEGRVNADTLVWRQELPDWIPARSCPEFSSGFGPAAPPPLPASDKARNAYTGSAVIWGIQLLLGLYWAFALAEEMGFSGMGQDAVKGFSFMMFVALGISAVLFVGYLMKNNSARVLGIAGSVLGILRTFTEMKKGDGEDTAFFFIGILLNIVFIVFAVQAKPLFRQKPSAYP